MELHVTFTLSDRFFALLEDKLPNLGRRVEKAVSKELGAKVRQESNISISVKPSETVETAETSEDAPCVSISVKPSAPVATVEEIPQPKAPEPNPFVEASIQQSEKKSGEMIREIMHRTRQRFEGEDYKENAESEAYKKYHRALTAQFKQIAITLGYEKPSYIDTPEGIAAFAAECDALIIDEKGFIAPPQHPIK